MMVREDVASLDYCKHLKEAGYIQKGRWWWEYFDVPYGHYECVNKLVDKSDLKHNMACVAPTASDLLKILPAMINYYGNSRRQQLQITKNPEGEWCIGYEALLIDEIVCQFYNFKLEDVLAEMWLELKERNLL